MINTPTEVLDRRSELLAEIKSRPADPRRALKLLRLFAELDVYQVALLAAVSASKLEQFEHGQTSMTQAEVTQVARALAATLHQRNNAAVKLRAKLVRKKAAAKKRPRGDAELFRRGRKRVPDEIRDAARGSDAPAAWTQQTDGSRVSQQVLSSPQ